jgi:hypothetical protein
MDPQERLARERHVNVLTDLSAERARALTSEPTCLQYYADGEAPPGFETLGICADTTNGPCAADGAYGRACAKGLE